MVIGADYKSDQNWQRDSCEFSQTPAIVKRFSADIDNQVGKDNECEAPERET